MKNLTIISVFVLTMGLTLPAFAAGSSSQDQALQAAEADAIVRGTIVSMDPATESLTITDYISGADRTFAVIRKADLNEFKAGDKVNITPQKGNPGAAQKIEKDRS